LDLGSPFGQGGARNSGEPESHTRKDAEHSPYGKDVVEMRHDIISIMECDIEGAVSQHDAGKAAYREKEKEAQYS